MKDTQITSSSVLSTIFLLVLLMVAVPAWASGATVNHKSYKSSEVNLYIDRSGRTIVKSPKKFKSFDFHEGIAVIEGAPDENCNRPKSFIDRSGKIITPDTFYQVSEFGEGLAAAGDCCRMGFIDKCGQFVIPKKYERVGLFREGLAPVVLNGKCGFIDKTGDLVIDAVFDNATCFSEGLAAVETEGRIGFIDTKGNWQIKPQFYRVQGFSNGIAFVDSISPRAEKFINVRGETIAKIIEHGEAWVPSRERIDKLTGMYAQDRQQLKGTYFEDYMSFSDGLAPLSRDKKFGYINTSGQFIIQPQFDRAYAFVDARGLIWMEHEKKYGFIDKTGKIVIAPQFEDARNFSEGLAAVAIAKNKWGYINPEGKFVIPPKYWEAHSFKEGVGHVLKEELCICGPAKKKK